ncbi:Protein of unknown function [Leuconostoc citreum]|nr:Protein of unknown function [Leuconostoc citreum]
MLVHHQVVLTHQKVALVQQVVVTAVIKTSISLMKVD